jgi:hypothetical protein
MANNSLTILTNRFFALVLKSPIQMGWLSTINSVTNISRLGTFKFPTRVVRPIRTVPVLLSGGWLLNYILSFLSTNTAHVPEVLDEFQNFFCGLLNFKRRERWWKPYKYAWHILHTRDMLNPWDIEAYLNCCFLNPIENCKSIFCC